MKEALVVVSFLLVVSICLLLFQYDKQAFFKADLAIEQAKSVTGPCGDRFVVAGLGYQKRQAVVAGELVPVEAVSNYFQRETWENGREVIMIYKKEDDGKERLLFRRPK